MERGKAIRIGICLIWAVFCLFPIFWIFDLSITPNEKAMAFPPKLVTTPTLGNYIHVLGNPNLLGSVCNSLVVATSAAVLAVILTCLAGYAFSRYDFRGKGFLLSLVLGIYMIYPLANVIPIFNMFSKLGLTDSRLGLILVDQSLFLPLNLFLFKNYFDTFPDEIGDAAVIDGYGPFQTFRKIFLPLAAPAMVTAFIFAFRFAWNEFVLAQTLVMSPSKQVFMAQIYNFMGLKRVQWGYLGAVLIIALIPVLIILIFFQRRLVRGMTAGAVKG